MSIITQINDDDARRLVHSLIIEIRDLIKKLKESGDIQQKEELIRKWTVNFSYDESGISSFSKVGSVISKHTWSNAVYGVFFKVMTLQQYGAVLHFISSLQSLRAHPPFYLQRFCNKVITKFLSTDQIDETDIDEFVRIFLSDVKDLPVKIRVKVGLTGIILEPDEIQIDSQNILKKPKKEDFEREENVFYVLSSYNFPNPSAFLEISMNTNDQNTITNAIEKSITIFRLYHSGMIRSTSYQIYSSSIFFDMGETVGSGDHSEIHEKYLIKNTDVENFIRFWEKISIKIPESFYQQYDNHQNNFKTISYKRYSDAISYDSLIERRIATAIMGMESIFLKSGGEIAELEFRLGLRVAQLLKNVSYNPLLVKQAIKDAYNIRSKFLHGDHLSAERKQKITAKYGGNINNLLLLTLDFLRISLIISMTIQMDKEKFIKILDDSLLSHDLNSQLEQIIADGKSIILLSKLENQFALI